MTSTTQVCSLAIAVIVAGAAPEQVPAQETKAYEASFTVLRDDMSYDVRADGTYTYEEFESVRLNSAQGVKQRSQVPLRYSTSLQDLEVLEAYTTTKEGKRVDVEVDKIMLQQSPQSAAAPMFDDQKVKTVVFPAADVGAVLSLRWRRIQKTPQFPGAFSMAEVFPRSYDISASQVTLRAPEALEMRIDAVGLIGGGVSTDRPGTQLWRWTLSRTVAHSPEAGSVNAFDFSPHVIATTFPDYAAAGKAYQDRAQSKAAVTPTIQKLADEITLGITDKRAQAEALYRWVSAHIRYVAIFLDFGGVVPHEAEAIAQAKYGDCKDHVTVLEALLAAKGIKSSPVLVNLSDTYSLPKVAITPGVFNHAISYLPEFDLFVDSTAAVAPFGVLPVQERGKPALLTDDGHGLAKVVTLPPSDVKHDSVRVETELAVTAEGTIEGRSRIFNTGLFDLITRQIVINVPKGVEPQVASRILTLTGQGGTGTFSFGDAHDLSSPYLYATEFALPNQVQIPGPGAFAIPTGLGSFSGIYTAFELMGLPRRDFPMAMVSGRREEVTVLRLPDSIKVSAVPNPTVLDSSVGHYESSYTQKGNELTITRVLQLNPPPVVEAENYQKLRAMAAVVMRDLRLQVVYQ